ncbi:hypothetical protein NQZ68_016287 [Dissostichus eleginoides]|nr:hypothetical protein NQZ68_016287 [Dissostichus eleginoides]
MAEGRVVQEDRAQMSGRKTECKTEEGFLATCQIEIESIPFVPVSWASLIDIC